MQNYTSVKLVHRSAWDFLEYNPQGRALLQKASWSFVDVVDALARAFEGAAMVGLFVFQDSLSPMAGIDGSNLGAENKGQGFGRVGSSAIRSFASSAKNLFALNRKLCLQRCDTDRHGRLEGLHRCTLTYFQRLSQILDCEQLSAECDNHTWPAPFLHIFELIMSMPAEHVWLWLMITQKEVSYVLELLDRSHTPALRLFFDATMYALRSLNREIHDLSDYEMAGCITPKQDTVDALKLIQKLLELGLDPNEKALESYFPGTCLVGYWDYLYSNVTNWQVYLSWLDSVTFRYELARGGDDFFEGPGEVCREAVALMNGFLRHGADVKVSILLEQDLAAVQGSGIKRRFLSLSFKLPASEIIDDLKIRVAYANDAMDEYWRNSTTVNYCEVTKSVASPGSAHDVLRFFTPEQQTDLSRLIQQQREPQWVESSFSKN